MIAAWLALVGCAMVFAGGLLGAGAGERRAWRAAAAFAVAAAAVTAWWWLPPRGALGPDVALAAHAHGRPVHTVVVVQPEAGRREVRRMDLRRPVPAAPWALGAMAAGGLLGGLLLRRSRAGSAGERAAAALPVAGAAAALGVLASAAGRAEGEPAVRAALGRVEPALAGLGARIESFTVPEGAWSHGTPMVLAIAVALIAFLATVLARRASGGRATGLVVGAGAALAAAAPAARMLAVGGLFWRPLEGALWGAALLAAGAALDTAGGGRRSTLAAAGLVVAALAVAVAWS